LVVSEHSVMDFGEEGNLGFQAGDCVCFANTGGYSTVGFHLIPPTGGTVTFEASFDNVNWEPITVRGINSDVLTQTADAEDDFIGSIAGGRSFRVRTSSAGSTLGTVVGRAQRDAAVIETIEFGAPPHRVGYDLIHKDGEYTTAQAATALWTPASGNKFVVTDMTLIAAGTTDATVSIFDAADASGSRLFYSAVDVSNNRQFSYNHSFRVPWVSAAADNVLKVTTDANITLFVGVHGYEV
jgi:hypothetical protein